MKKTVILMILSCTLSSCMVDMRRQLLNDKGSIYDVEDFFAVPDTVLLKFGLSDDEDIQKYSSDSLNPRLKYSLNIPCAILPTVKLNSFSFTCKKDSDTIPSILYYRTDGRVIHIIDSLPIIFTNEIKNDMKYKTFEIFAECSQSYRKTKKVYINYDIEIGNEHIIKQIKYSRRRQFDWRPKF